MFTQSSHLYDALHAHKDYAGETAQLRRVIAVRCWFSMRTKTTPLYPGSE